MSANWRQVFLANPTTTFNSNDIFYLARSPYGATDDFGFTYSSFIPVNTKGDLFTWSTAAAKLAVGTNGQVLSANSAQTTGLQWITPTFGALTTLEVTGATQAISVNTAYISNNGARIEFSLPATAVIGSLVNITGKGVGGWRINTGIGQTIQVGESFVTGIGDYVESTDATDSITLICTTTNTTWTTYCAPQGNIYLNTLVSGTNNAVNVNLSDQTGTGKFVGDTSPSFITPALGTPSSGNLSNCTNIPTSGITGILPLANGGTNANLTPSNGGIIYSTATAMAVLSAGTSGQIIQSQGGSAPIWTDMVYQTVCAANRIFYGATANGMGQIANGTSGILITNASQVPSWTSALTDGQIVIGTTSGTPAAANLTQGANMVITNGAGSITISGSATPTFTAPVLGTPASGNLSNCTSIPVAQATGTLPVANGGTGQTTYTDGQLLIGNSSGNTLTKATLTGTSNQVSVANGSGSITLSLPQSIATTSTPTFANLTLEQSNATGFSQTIQNTSNANNTTKIAGINFGGTDTVGTVKLSGAIQYAPLDADYVDSKTVFYTRVADAPVVGMTLTGTALAVVGALSKGSGTFKIDHPLDPENKYLYHSFVESPDMMNIYNGNVILDVNGEAIVELPSYFEVLNKDHRFQLTSVGSFQSVYIKSKISNNSFEISGGTEGAEISWQVTGIRQDKFANENRVVPEVEKEPNMQGKYLHPAEWGII
jgi:hypothetical protein